MDKYEVNDISERRLDLAYWLLTHTEQLKKIALKVFIGFCIALWAAFFFFLFTYLKDLPQDKVIATGLINGSPDLEKFFSEHKALPLNFSGAQTIYSGNNLYDFVALAQNSNLDRGVARLTYRFRAGNFSTPTNSVAILPNQKVYLLSLANKIPGGVSSAELEIVAINWESWQHIQSITTPLIDISELGWNNSGNWGSHLTFKAKNNSLFNIWEVVFQGVVSDGSQIVAVNQLTSEEFLTGEIRSMEMSWFNSLPANVKVEVVPMVRAYDPESFYETPGKVNSDL